MFFMNSGCKSSSLIDMGSSTSTGSLTFPLLVKQKLNLRNWDNILFFYSPLLQHIEKSGLLIVPLVFSSNHINAPHSGQFIFLGGIK